jgi:integrase
MVRHSRQDALNDTEFQRLVDACDDLEEPYDRECLFILVAGGRLGMRAGEISHCREDWVDWTRLQIEIPRHEPCDCGYCRDQAHQSIGYDPSIDLEDEMAERWKPKTSNSARAIPFDFDDFTEAVVTTFFDQHEEFPKSRVAINRRVDRVAEAAGVDKYSVYPHALRATAATYHAYQGVSAPALQSLMGWNQLSTAQKYIRLSGSATADALRDAHGD